MAYDIKDISLWESGETKIRWVMGNMPLLCGIGLLVVDLLFIIF